MTIPPKNIHTDPADEAGFSLFPQHYDDHDWQVINARIDSFRALDAYLAKFEVEETSIVKAMNKLEKTFDGDSNDEEHDAAVELVDLIRKSLKPQKENPNEA